MILQTKQYMSQLLKIAFCRPVPIDRDKSRLSWRGCLLFVGFHPTPVYVALPDVSG